MEILIGNSGLFQRRSPYFSVQITKFGDVIDYERDLWTSERSDFLDLSLENRLSRFFPNPILKTCCSQISVIF